MPEKYKIFNSIEEAKASINLLKTKLIRVGRTDICLIHAPEGLRAVKDSCPHMGASLATGHVNYLGEIGCPWHGWRFCSHTGEEKTGKDTWLRTYKITEEPEGVFVWV